MFNIKESYLEISIALEGLIKTIEQVHSAGKIEINSKNYFLKILLGGDLKYLALVLGINAANANYPCVFCVCPKSQFHNTKKEWSIVDKSKGARSLIEAESRHKDKVLGYINKPLFNFIEYFEVVFDTLHAFLRITEKLIELLFYSLIIMDLGEDGINLEKRKNFNLFVKFLTTKLNLTNPFYASKNELKLRSLNGNERFEIFKNIHITKLFSSHTFEKDDRQKFQKTEYLWGEFFEIYIYIKNFDLDEEGEKYRFGSEFIIKLLSIRLKAWLDLYTEIYPVNSITPYMHIFVYHLPEYLKLYKNINLFNLQGLERLNQVTIKYYHRSTNKHKNNFKWLRQLLNKRLRIEYYLLKNKAEIQNLNDDNKGFYFF